MTWSFPGEGGWGAMSYADVAAALPEAFLSGGAASYFAEAAAALEMLAASAGSGAEVTVSAADGAPDPVASLWFIRAAHLFAKTGVETLRAEKFLRLSKRMLQDFIAGRGLGGVKMDDGGLLIVPADRPAWLALRLNSLWYSALESTAADLKKAGDKTGDHFERLAGRFRRAFAKAYWCDGHNCICPPYRRSADSHGDIADPEQLLMTVLPASAIPRTKQRQIVQAVRAKNAASTERTPGLPMDHPTLGRVESLLHRAWLGAGLLNVAENPEAVRLEARLLLAPLAQALRHSRGAGLIPYYRDGRPVDGLKPDPLTTAHVAAAVALVER